LHGQIANDICNLSLATSLRQDAHGLVSEIYHRRRRRSGAENDKVKVTLSFTLTQLEIAVCCNDVNDRIR
jgi:hypothetical protein